MKEQLVSFKVARLAKEKGFNEKCFNYYFEDGTFQENIIKDTYGYYGEEYTVEFDELLENWNSEWLTKKNGDRCFGCSKSRGYLETYSATTQSLLQRWIREKHSIDIIVSSNLVGHGYILYNRNPHKNITNRNVYQTYEEALEVGLEESLKLIK